MEPEFEDMSTDVRERRGVGTSQLQVFFNHCPAGGLVPSEQSWVVEVAFWMGRQEDRGTMWLDQALQ